MINGRPLPPLQKVLLLAPPVAGLAPWPDLRCKKGRPDRTLTDDDIAYCRRFVVALKETIRLMEEIDEVIEEHGSWPIE